MNVELGRNRLRGILHLPSPTAAARFASGVLMVAGAGGGLQGPSGIYPTLSRKLQKSGVLALRLDYRRANQLSMCVDDVKDAIRELNSQYGVERVVLVGTISPLPVAFPLERYLTLVSVRCGWIV
jgi:hypothetical protein